MANTVTTSADGNKRKRVKTVQSKVSCSSPGKVCKGKNCCGNCRKRDKSINDLQNKIKELEENEASMQKRIQIYENLGLAHLAQEAENKALMKEKQDLQEKLVQAENDYLHSFEEEEKEIQILEKRKKALELKLLWRTKQRKDRGQMDDDHLRHLRMTIEENDKSEAQYGEKLEALKKEHPVLKERLAAVKEMYEHNPKVLPPEEQFPEFCEICKKLDEGITKFKNEYKSGEKEEPIVMEKLKNRMTEMFNEALEIAELKLEIEYMKKRIPNQHQYTSGDYEDRQRACKNDFHDREHFSERMCILLDQHFHTKKFNVQPTSAFRMPMCKMERALLERLKKRGKKICCGQFRRLHCQRYFCGGYANQYRTMEEREEIEKEAHYFNCPGIVVTEVGRKKYLGQTLIELLDTLGVDKYSNIDINEKEFMSEWHRY